MTGAMYISDWLAVSKECGDFHVWMVTKKLSDG